jgi:uncharacterized protein with HEPN domain
VSFVSASSCRLGLFVVDSGVLSWTRGPRWIDLVAREAMKDLKDIAGYCGSAHGAFLDNRMRQDATLRKLEVIGQAVKNLSEHTELPRPEIPCKQIAGMRDKVIHDDFGVNVEIVWAVVQTDLPKPALLYARF